MTKKIYEYNYNDNENTRTSTEPLALRIEVLCPPSGAQVFIWLWSPTPLCSASLYISGILSMSWGPLAPRVEVLGGITSWSRSLETKFSTKISYTPLLSKILHICVVMREVFYSGCRSGDPKRIFDLNGSRGRRKTFPHIFATTTSSAAPSGVQMITSYIVRMQNCPEMMKSQFYTIFLVSVKIRVVSGIEGYVHTVKDSFCSNNPCLGVV